MADLSTSFDPAAVGTSSDASSDAKSRADAASDAASNALSKIAANSAVWAAGGALNGLSTIGRSEAVADDATVTALPSITNACFGYIQVGNNEEYALFLIDNDGDVVLLMNSANIVSGADTDGKFCIGTAATQEPLVIRNRLGASKNVNLMLWYN
jgi:hypothetical protein